MAGNMFSEYAKQHEEEQKKIKEEVSTVSESSKSVKKTNAEKKATRGKFTKLDGMPVRTKKTEEATTMTVYIKVADKKKLKAYALKNGKSSAAVISEMINKYCID